MTARQNHSDEAEEYEVVRQFTAYFVPDGGQVQDLYTLEKGAIIRADPKTGQRSSRETALVVRFVFDERWFYVDRETFDICARKR